MFTIPVGLFEKYAAEALNDRTFQTHVVYRNA